MKTPSHPSPLRRGLGGCGQVLVWAIILGVGAIIAVAVIVPRVIGGTPYVILTGSMEPSMPPGTMVVARPVPTQDIGVGTVVTYQLRSGDPTVVTHRVRSVQIDLRGNERFITQGDANDAPDARPVMPVQVRGERAYDVPYLGYVTTLVTSGQRSWAIGLVVVALLGYAAAMFTGSVRDRRRARAARRTPQAHADPAGPADQAAVDPRAGRRALS